MRVRKTCILPTTNYLQTYSSLVIPFLPYFFLRPTQSYSPATARRRRRRRVPARISFRISQRLTELEYWSARGLNSQWFYPWHLSLYVIFLHAYDFPYIWFCRREHERAWLDSLEDIVSTADDERKDGVRKEKLAEGRRTEWKNKLVAIFFLNIILVTNYIFAGMFTYLYLTSISWNLLLVGLEILC